MLKVGITGNPSRIRDIIKVMQEKDIEVSLFEEEKDINKSFSIIINELKERESNG